MLVYFGTPVLNIHSLSLLILILSVFHVYLYLLNANTSKMSEDQKPMSLAVRGNEVLGYKVYKVLTQKEKGNLLMCPLSAETILALTFMGAKGVTAKEMADTLGLPEDIDITAEGFSQLTSELSKTTGVTLNTANKIFVENRFQLKDSFKQIASEKFLAEAENVNFLHKSEECRKMINDWVSDKTNNKIQNLLEQLTSDTIMVLVNAIYFHGNWTKPFHLMPDPLKFMISETESVDVPSLFIKSKFRYCNDVDLDAQILELPYEGGEFSFLIILPRKINGLAALEEKLPISLDKEFVFCEVEVTIPKFKLEKTIQLNDILKELGMVTAFSNGADFSGMGNQEIKISEVIQKAFIDVNEKGTEAAAATAVRMVRCMAFIDPSPPEKFNADHPFLFILRQNSLNVNMFIGRFVKSV